MSTDRVTGPRPFTHGSERTVYADATGQQYVICDDGQPVFGQWLPPADEPARVEEGGPLTEIRKEFQIHVAVRLRSVTLPLDSQSLFTNTAH
jgi:hypothetical protein